MKYSEPEKLLRQANCTALREGSNHRVWYSPKTGETFPVGRYKSEDVPVGTLEKIKKAAGLKYVPPPLMKGASRMAKYVYPAVFTPESDGGYSIDFPDIKNCFTGAASLFEALEMANDVLCLTLYGFEEAGQPIPQASQSNDVAVKGSSFVSLVGCDTVEYRRFYDNKAVKKTLSIPSWLNDMAERADVNFSGVLQEALKAKLNI